MPAVSSGESEGDSDYDESTSLHHTPHIEDGDAACIASTADLPEVRLKGADDTL